jgi:hypothetical protein
MSMHKWAAHFVSVFLIAAAMLVATQAQAQSAGRVYELRTYTSHEGRLDDVVARFRNHTTRLFEKHGMINVGYWVPREQPNTLIYIISHASRDAANKSWDAFRKDPEWITARTASEANGPIVVKTQSLFMDPTNFSGLK